MPRPSAASLSILNPAGTRPRLSPPADLGELERKTFIDIVTSVDSGHFRESDLPLLCAYCRAVVAEREAAGELARAPVVDGEPSPWLRVHQAAIKTMMGLSMRLRLSPQARQPNNPSRPAASISYYERMRMEADDEDDETEALSEADLDALRRAVRWVERYARGYPEITMLPSPMPPEGSPKWITEARALRFDCPIANARAPAMEGVAVPLPTMRSAPTSAMADLRKRSSCGSA